MGPLPIMYNTTLIHNNPAKLTSLEWFSRFQQAVWRDWVCAFYGFLLECTPFLSCNSFLQNGWIYCSREIVEWSVEGFTSRTFKQIHSRKRFVRGVSPHRLRRVVARNGLFYESQRMPGIISGSSNAVIKDIFARRFSYIRYGNLTVPPGVLV